VDAAAARGESSKLKRLVAELSPDRHILQMIIAKALSWKIGLGRPTRLRTAGLIPVTTGKSGARTARKRDAGVPPE
jgi:hypothetical protein